MVASGALPQGLTLSASTGVIGVELDPAKITSTFATAAQRLIGTATDRAA